MSVVNRTTNLQTANAFAATILRQQVELERVRQEISTGLKVVNPSDDPGRAGTVAGFLADLQSLDRYKQRMGLVTNILNQQESTLDSAEIVLERARELANQSASETVGAEQRGLIAEEIFKLRDTLVGLANTKVNGQYIYGGGDGANPPFIADDYDFPVDTGDPAHVRYVFDDNPGRSLTRSAQLSESTSITITSPGDQVFENAISSLERLGRALSGYRTDPEDWSTTPTGTGNPFTFPDDYTAQTAAIRAAIDPLEAARNGDIVGERTRVGSSSARVEQELNINAQVKLNVEQLRATVQDTDIVEAASRFASLQTSLEGSLQTGVTINQLSLLDFI